MILPLICRFLTARSTTFQLRWPTSSVSWPARQMVLGRARCSTSWTLSAASLCSWGTRDARELARSWRLRRHARGNSTSQGIWVRVYLWVSVWVSVCMCLCDWWLTCRCFFLPSVTAYIRRCERIKYHNQEGLEVCFFRILNYCLGKLSNHFY